MIAGQLSKRKCLGLPCISLQQKLAVTNLGAQLIFLKLIHLECCINGRTAGVCVDDFKMKMQL